MPLFFYKAPDLLPKEQAELVRWEGQGIFLVQCGQQSEVRDNTTGFNSS